MIESGALAAFHHLLGSEKENIRKEACWTLSNITAGTQTQIQSVIDYNLVPPLIFLLGTGDYKTRREAVWALSNLTAGGAASQV